MSAICGVTTRTGTGFSPSNPSARPCPHGYTWECPQCKEAIRHAIARLGGPWYPPGTYQTCSGPWGQAHMTLAELLREVYDTDRRHRSQSSVDGRLLEGPNGRHRRYGRRQEDQEGGERRRTSNERRDVAYVDRKRRTDHR